MTFEKRCLNGSMAGNSFPLFGGIGNAFSSYGTALNNTLNSAKSGVGNFFSGIGSDLSSLGNTNANAKTNIISPLPQGNTIPTVTPQMNQQMTDFQNYIASMNQQSQGGGQVQSTQSSGGPGGITLGSYNPTTLTQDQRNWLWTQNGHSGQAPVGYGGEGGSSGSSGTNPSDYYQSALQMLQPVIQAQIAPLEQQQQLLPSIYQNMQKTLQDQQAANTQASTDFIKNLQNQTDTTKGMLQQQNTQQLGQQRANEAANGIASSSGVEKSQEANINQNLANTLTQLQTNVSGQETANEHQTQALNTQLADQIAALPNQESKDALAFGAEIAKVQGGGYMDALNYGAQMAQFQSDLYFKQANLAIAQGNQQIAYQNMILGNQIKQGQLGIEKMQAQISAASSFANVAKDVNPPTTTSTVTTPANLFGGLITLPWGTSKTTTSQSSGLSPEAANNLAGMYSSLFGGQ